ncbi:hypothetical protein GCK72_016813 [Caenorhabditis remanei]|uniref:F-box domain-containing protein n=1 Tax=Caenorhabditis remanei TaxID=31234 RepID=A0A6A5G5W6_CAERE|nr:hypothetical protein GCK72_016813 [Caenorhabditis remanei]KAF1750266.1 hypothetical protein GCK72_016813 [Caenorhabditis remanei]
MEKPFPLFRLPRLAIEEVISTMTPFEIINFSMTSLKIKYFIKCLLRTSRNSQYVLQVNTTKEPIIVLRGSEIYFKIKITSFKTMNRQIEYKHDFEIQKYDIFWIYSENLIDEWMNFVRIVKEVFQIEEHIVIFHIDQFPTRNKLIVDFIKSLTPSIESCEFHGKTETDEDVEYFLNNLNVTEFVGFNLKLSDRFTFPQDNFLEGFTIDPANWLTFDKLLRLKGSEFYIHGSPLTNQELNQFLILWMTSQCHQNLGYLLININDPQSVDIIFNLPFEIMNPNVERIGRLPNNDTISLKEGIDIKRNDGMTGTINFDRRLDKMLLTMVVSQIN